MARAYDKAKWHYEADDFPPGLPTHRGATHIGYFVRWCVENDLIHPELKSRDPRALQKLSRGKLLPGRFVLEHLGGALIDEDLSRTGNAFAKAAYDEYLRATESTLRRIAKPTYLAPVSEKTYTALSAVLDDLFRRWQKRRTPRRASVRISRASLGAKKSGGG